MDGRAILRTRLDTLLSDLAKVSRAVDLATAKREHIHAALDSLAHAEAGVRVLEVTAAVVGIELGAGEDGQLGAVTEHRLLTSLNDLGADVRKVQEELAAIKRLLEPVRDRMVVIGNQKALEAALQDDCFDLTEEARELRELADDDAADLPGLWRDYLGFVDTKARPLFDAYVDFISGLAVRDSDLDGSVCAISDHLLTRLLGQHEALSLPAREAALSMHAIIKLGFPEWGVWSVPLAAREAGANLLRNAKIRTLHRFLNGPRGRVPGAEQLAEDALGAFMLGPAYARAMFTFRLRPGWPAQPGMPPDTQRAEIILGILRRQGDPDGQDAFSDEVARLSAFWESAATDLGADPAARLDPGFVAGVHEALRMGRRRDFSAANWGETVLWARHLLDRPGGGQPPELVEADRVVILLNAGWLARLESPEREPAVADRLMELIRQNGTSRASGARPLPPPASPHLPPGRSR
ncbi:hypothetical protein [Nonomuraea longicatena]|uniref:Uncharacterized protein n=1 Tax=Nonomuraea longicatena TaxID=83682 RepID=A0ABP3Z203_9ACTN